MWKRRGVKLRFSFNKEDDEMAENEPTKSLIGRGVIIVVPLVIIVMLVLILFPTRYYYKVSDGQLSLWVGKLGWLDSQQSKALDPIPVGSADFAQLTQQSFETESEALSAIGSLITTRIEEEKEKVYPLEKQLADVYKELLGYLKAAQKIGLQENGDEIAAVEGWLNHYQVRLQQEHTARSQRVTGSETFPYEMVSRSAEKGPAKAVEQPKEDHGAGHGGEKPVQHEPKAEHK